MRVKIMSDSKRIKEKVHFSVSGLAGAVHEIELKQEIGIIILLFRKHKHLKRRQNGF